MNRRVIEGSLAGLFEMARFARAGRYAMCRRHEPALAMRVLSCARLLPLCGFRFADVVFGRIGNEFVVQAIRA